MAKQPVEPYSIRSSMQGEWESLLQVSSWQWLCALFRCRGKGDAYVRLTTSVAELQQEDFDEAYATTIIVRKL